MKVAVFGGTFDPVHNGHLQTAEYVIQQRDIDNLIFIPANISPHKTENKVSSPVHRLNMLELAISENPKMIIDDYELRHKGVSYTFRTLQYLNQKFGSVELIIGYDNYLVFDKWKKYEEILRNCKVLVLKRKNENGAQQPEDFDQSFIFLDSPILDISSSQIRNLLKQNKKIDGLVPLGVKKYIEKHNLYR